MCRYIWSSQIVGKCAAIYPNCPDEAHVYVSPMTSHCSTVCLTIQYVTKQLIPTIYINS